MSKQSAGILAFRRSADHALQVFLVHPGGPFWAKKDAGAWSLPKGEFADTEDALAAAKREFHEETGFSLVGEFLPLGQAKQKGGKVVTAWAVEADLDPKLVRSNTFTLEWPPTSGRKQNYPEVDRADWFSLNEAREKILGGQAVFLERLALMLPKLGGAQSG
jgi:predicted NUDIX family NTP pyrophosphohydrolase